MNNAQAMFDNRECVFSSDRIYRYTLWREWDVMYVRDYAAFIGLNPSTADETKDDPTIRRCIDFSKRLGVGACCALNLYAYRATLPKDLFSQKDPIGPDNDQWICRVVKNAAIVIAAWGTLGVRKHRGQQITQSHGDRLMCLGYTKSHHPRHPRCVPSDTKLIKFDPPWNQT